MPSSYAVERLSSYSFIMHALHGILSDINLITDANNYGI